MNVTLNVWRERFWWGPELVCVCGFLNEDAAELAVKRSQFDKPNYKYAVYDLAGQVLRSKGLKSDKKTV